MSDNHTKLEQFIDARKRARRTLRTLAALYDGLSEHDSDCAWLQGGMCDCGAEDFARKFAAWSRDAPR